MTESPSPATWPGSPSLIWGPQEGIPPQPAPGPLSGLPRNAGACSPFPHYLRSRDPHTPPSSGRHCACWWLQTGSWSKEASGIHPLASSAQSTTPDLLPAHCTNHLSPRSIPGDGSEQPRNQKGGPTSAPTCPEGAIIWGKIWSASPRDHLFTAHCTGSSEKYNCDHMSAKTGKSYTSYCSDLYLETHSGGTAALGGLLSDYLLSVH